MSNRTCLTHWRPFQEPGGILDIGTQNESQQLSLMMCDDEGTKQSQEKMNILTFASVFYWAVFTILQSQNS